MKFNIKKSVMLASIIVGALWISGCATSTPTPTPISKVVDIPKDLNYTKVDCITGEKIDLSNMLENQKAYDTSLKHLSGFNSYSDAKNINIDESKLTGVKAKKKPIEIGGISIMHKNNTAYNINYVNDVSTNLISIIPPLRKLIGNASGDFIELPLIPFHLVLGMLGMFVVDFVDNPGSTISYNFDITKFSDTQLKVSLNMNPTIKRTGAYHSIYNYYYDIKGGEKATKKDVENIFNIFNPLNIPVKASMQDSAVMSSNKAILTIESVLEDNGYTLINSTQIDHARLKSLVSFIGYSPIDGKPRFVYDPKFDNVLKSNAKIYYKKTIIGNGQPLISKVTVLDIDTGSIFKQINVIAIDQYIDMYYAYPNGSCSITPSIFKEAIYKEKTNLAKVL